jgi:hypothetical protein
MAKLGFPMSSLSESKPILWPIASDLSLPFFFLLSSFFFPSLEGPSVHLQVRWLLVSGGILHPTCTHAVIVRNTANQ